MRLDRLKTLADHLVNEQLLLDKFDFRYFYLYDTYDTLDNCPCNTVGCAIGETALLWKDHWIIEVSTPILRRTTTVDVDKELSPIDSAVIFFDISLDDAKLLFMPCFDISLDDATLLFMPCNGSPHYTGIRSLQTNATKEEVAYNIYKFIQWHKYKRICESQELEKELV